jgi:putative phosphoesterase
MTPDADRSRSETVDLAGAQRLGIVADTHGLVRPELHTVLAGVDAILHAGDLGGEDVEIELGAIAPFYAVAGNVDGFEASPHPRWRIFRIGGRRVGLTHVALQRGRSLIPSVERWCRIEAIELLIFGHTHRPLIRQDATGPLLFNPGSCGPRRFALPVTAGFLHVDGGGALRPELLEIDARS